MLSGMRNDTRTYDSLEVGIHTERAPSNECLAAKSSCQCPGKVDVHESFRRLAESWHVHGFTDTRGNQYTSDEWQL